MAILITAGERESRMRNKAEQRDSKTSGIRALIERCLLVLLKFHHTVNFVHCLATLSWILCFMNTTCVKKHHY